MTTTRNTRPLSGLVAGAAFALVSTFVAMGGALAQESPDLYAGASAYDPYGQPGYGNPGASNPAYSNDGSVDPATNAYAYVSTLDGAGSLVAAGGEAQALELNQPLAAGDRVSIARGSRAELVLPDGGVARLDGDSELVFVDVDSADVDSPDAGGQNALRLDNGSLQVVVGTAGSSAVRVDTPNVTAYFDAAGRYLVETEGSSGWTRVVVREGNCDLMTERGSQQLQAGEEAQIEGDARAAVQVSDAGGWTAIERWGGGLDEQARRADVNYVDPSLRYASTQLAYNGNWLSVDGQYAWRPRVDASWRPYWNGRWASTGSGLTWVSHEPWGWVTSHYGNWDYRQGSGWLWYPGSRYSPARVYWYWGPTHVGWCPSGYYTHYYGASSFGAGIYGWAGGWGGFLDWNFVPTRYLGSYGLNRYCRRGSDLRGEFRDGLPRGIITTDTRGSRHWSRPDDILRDWQGQGRAGRTRPGDTLPDVSSFVSRRNDLDPGVRRRIATIGERGEQPILRLDGERGRVTPRPEPWARQRPVERGGETPIDRGGYDSGGTSRRDTAPRGSQPILRMPSGPDQPRSPRRGGTSDPGASWRQPVQPLQNGERGRGDRNTISSPGGNLAPGRDWRSSRVTPPGRSSPGEAAPEPSMRPRVQVPQRTQGPQTLDWRSQSPSRAGEARRAEPSTRSSRPDSSRPEARQRSGGDETNRDRGRTTESTPIRRIVEGVRQSPPPPRPQTSESRRSEPPRASDRGASSQARSSRPSRESTQGQRDSRGSRSSSEGNGRPPQDQN